jgi:hypothetical protein
MASEAIPEVAAHLFQNPTARLDRAETQRGRDGWSCVIFPCVRVS